MPGLVHRLMPRHPGSMPLPPVHGAQPGSGFEEGVLMQRWRRGEEG